MCQATVVFDTNCVLCSGMVAFILAHEQDNALHFVGAWSAEGLTLAARYHFSQADLNDTFLVIHRGTALAKSDAGIQILGHLRAPWCWLTALRVVPRPMRDAAYSFIARHRYQWLGRAENCVAVPASQKHRFIGVGR